MKLFAFTIDLEADYAGVIDRYGIFEEPGKIEDVLSALNSAGMKITVFVVGEILKRFPEIIRLFEKYGCEFEPHSHTHNLDTPDSEAEIIQARSAYIDYFQKAPMGYRAPRGKISDSGIKLLEQHGFLYDSSVFPSWFPDPFRYLFRDKNIHYYNDSRIMEIPFTSVSPLRLTLSASSLKLFGVDFFTKPTLPDVVCFCSHLHDFIINEKSLGELSLFWRLIYSRNRHRGVDCTLKFLEHVKMKGYEFCYMSEIYDAHK